MEPEADKSLKQQHLENILRACNKSMAKMRKGKRKLKVLETSIDALFKAGEISEFCHVLEKEDLRRTRVDAECCLRVLYERIRAVRLELRKMS